MSTANQANASRANGAQSHGPCTPEGKKTVSQNATTHGLTAQAALLPHESAEDYHLLSRSLVDSFNPANGAEWVLVNEIADTSWRIRRANTIQSQQYSLQMAVDLARNTATLAAFEPVKLAIAEQGQAVNKSVNTIRAHEDRLILLRDRLINQLRKLQKDRRDATPPPAAPANQNSQNKPKPVAVTIQKIAEVIEIDAEKSPQPNEPDPETM